MVHSPQFILSVIVALCMAACRKPAMVPGADLYVMAKRVAVSTVPTPKEIAPYDDALTWQDYEIIKVMNGTLEGETVRVAHWAVAAGKAVPVSVEIGETVPLSLDAYDKTPSLDAVAKRDDLDFLTSPPRYVALLPPNDATAPPEALRYDYQGHFSEQMRLYWKLRPQLRLVVLGNSHATKGIAPQMLLGEENKETPLALNLAPAGASNGMQCLIAREYLLPLPRLETVVWVVSARNFNQERQETRKLKEFLASPGWENDQREKANLWPVETAPTLVTSTELKSLDLKEFDVWGWSARGKGPLPDSGDTAAVLEYARKQSGTENFTWDEAAWQELITTVRAFNERGVRVFVLTTPMHPVMRSVPAADADWTTDAGLATLVTKAQSLDELRPLTHFHDFNAAEQHAFPADEFYDLDHLNRKGARHLTRLIDEWMKQAK